MIQENRSCTFSVHNGSFLPGLISPLNGNQSFVAQVASGDTQDYDNLLQSAVLTSDTLEDKHWEAKSKMMYVIQGQGEKF